MSPENQAGDEALVSADSRRFPPPLPEFHYAARPPQRAPKRRLWLHFVLLLATLFTTTLVGAHMQYNFSHNLPFFDIDRVTDVFLVGLQSPALFATGLPFSLTLLTILMAHELGHYLACVYYRVDATLPFFLPSPMPVTGTFGAFIRIRSPIHSKRILFDVGIAGPIAGFIFLLPALGAGLAFSKVLPGINHQGTLQLGVPALEWLAQKLIFPGVAASDIYLHPVARAAWVGMFATALNLLPVGQLDGGHVVYALLGRSQKWITNFFLVALLP
ncbi:MAG: site-2 protease family protein, partial [Bryobacteraceae bacterium]